MKKVSLYKYYQFGYNYRILRDSKGSISNELFYLNLKRYRDFIDDLNLKVVKSGLDLIGFYENFKALEKLAKNNETSQKNIDKQLFDKVIKSIDAIDAGLDGEMNLQTAYSISEKRNKLEYLTDKISKLFEDEDIFDELPEIASQDFIAAGKCIAFELPTSAAFHMLRGTESVLRLYYEKMIKTNRVSNRMWGPIVTDLQKKNKTKSYDVLNNQLKFIKDQYRNPTQHPEKVYSTFESEDLLGYCKDVVNQMMKILVEKGGIVIFPF